MKAYRFLEEADQEFQEHIGYFISLSLMAAEKFVDEVRAAVHDIRVYPQVGSPISPIVRQRVLTRYKYSILYVDTPNEIIIVAVAPHRRRPGYWRRRLRHLKHSAANTACIHGALDVQRRTLPLRCCSVVLLLSLSASG